MNERNFFDTSAVVSFGINKLDKIKENVCALVDLVEKRNLTASSREKEVLLYAIEDKILDLKDILDIK